MVGLVCIRIFGYSDPRAEKLAEETGVAFQLTNILRDVAEDAERRPRLSPAGRPRRAQRDPRSRCSIAQQGSPRPRTNAPCWLRSASRAENYYGSAKKLLPLIDRESRPALWVLVPIYHALLKRIRRADYDVFSRQRSACRLASEGRDSAGAGLARIARGAPGCVMTSPKWSAGARDQC